MKQSKIKIIDLCCGLGGISLAAKQLGLEPILGVDICKYALKSYEVNFPKATAMSADLSTVKAISRITNFLDEEKIDRNRLYIVSGPPCQGFSAAGKRLTNDPRNKLIINIAITIQEVQPEAAIIENVSFLKNRKYRKIIGRFQAVLNKAGYFCTAIELNANNFGVPQRRQRIFFLITKKAVSQESYVSYLEHLHRKTPNVRQALTGLPTPEVRPEHYTDELLSGGFYNHFCMRHSEKVRLKIASIQVGKGPFSYRKLNPFDCAPTLVAGHRAPPVHYNEPRSITAREAARIQSLPDSHRICGPFGSQLQQVANAVPPKLAKAVLKTLMNFVEQ